MSESAGWSDEELAASVAAYRRMQGMDAQGIHYVKADVYRQLAGKFGRTEKAFEFRMQNISAVLESLGQPWLQGLRPAANVGGNIAHRLGSLLNPPAQAAYIAKLPTMRCWLIEVARRGATATYGDLMAAFNVDRFSLRFALGRLGREAQHNGEPILTALVVNQATGRCSSGLAREFGVEDDVLERKRLYEFWIVRSPPEVVPFDEFDSSAESRAARFARVKIRPDQTRFRKAVYLACGGRCVLTGCSLERALDAAHLRGRKWQTGHNKATDGVLLRKDIHALYDAGHLRLEQDGSVDLDEEVKSHYPSLASARWRT